MLCFFFRLCTWTFETPSLRAARAQLAVSSPHRAAQQESFERALGLLPPGQLVAVKDEPIVVREYDLLFVLCRHAIVFVAQPCVFERVQYLARSDKLSAPGARI